MDLDQRIAQFEKLTADDASNDMAWFSLGGAYTQAERFGDAAGAYDKCVEINPDMSKAYQLSGEAHAAAGQNDVAVAVATKGYAVAAQRGDQLPRKAMAELLEKLGAAVPEVEKPKPAAAAVVDGSFVCTKTGQPGTKLGRPPFRGAVGEWIQEQISKETFDEWIALGTKIINELRLDLSRDEHDAVYDYAMRLYIGLSDEVYRGLAGAEPPVAGGEFVQVVDEMLSRGGHLEDFQGELHKKVGG